VPWKRRFRRAAWQRRIVHLERDPALVRALHHLAIDEVGAICPAAGELLEDAEADALAYLDLSHEHHMRLGTNDVQGRTDHETRRRSRVVQVSPSRRSLPRHVAAALPEMDGGRQPRCWFSSVSIQEAYEEKSQRPPAPRPTYEGTAAEHALPSSAW